MKITREMVEEFFDDARVLRDHGDARFDTDRICRWSFFFVDPDAAKLEPVAEHLRSMGYEIKGVMEPDEESERRVWLLRVDRVERHTPDSLHSRNIELQAVATRFGIEDYDGMDVGAVDGP
jgi:hypothetical protein